VKPETLENSPQNYITTQQSNKLVIKHIYANLFLKRCPTTQKKKKKKKRRKSPHQKNR
jgi:hypothetical protein